MLTALLRLTRPTALVSSTVMKRSQASGQREALSAIDVDRIAPDSRPMAKAERRYVRVKLEETRCQVPEMTEALATKQAFAAL